MTSEISLQAIVPASSAGLRLDQIAADLFPEYSRGRIQRWIQSGALTVNGQKHKRTMKVSGGEQLWVQAEEEHAGEWEPEPVPLDIIYEDEEIIVLNKPAGLVVHPAAGNWSGTLLNGLLYYSSALANIPRAGIVHRLDKDTTGLMVVAKTLRAQNDLVKQLQERRVTREYRAIAVGGPEGRGTVDQPIGRHPHARIKMAVLPKGKEAITHYEVMGTYGIFREVCLHLETGRTHQIRVHMAWLGCPLLGDPVYGKKLSESALTGLNSTVLTSFKRQALHAWALSLRHPASGQRQQWSCALPADHSAALDTLGKAYQ